MNNTSKTYKQLINSIATIVADVDGISKFKFSDFWDLGNSGDSGDYPLLHLLLPINKLRVKAGNQFNDQYSLEFTLVSNIADDSTPEVEITLIESIETIRNEFLTKLNQEYTVSELSENTIHKDTTDIVSGVQFTITLTTPSVKLC